MSEGIRGKISKLVIYSKTHLYNFYNLSFGAKNSITGNIDDEVITNNGDSEKVLATVASTLYIFIEKFPDAMVFVTGSTKARTRLYRIGITNILKKFKRISRYMAYTIIIGFRLRGNRVSNIPCKEKIEKANEVLRTFSLPKFSK